MERSTRIVNSIRYIHEHLSEELSLTALCKIAQMSRSRFSEYFHQYVGLSFKSYLNKARCDYAHMLLTTTDIPISECAEKSGFQNHSYFVKEFRSFYHHSPSEIRKLAKETSNTDTNSD